VRIHAFEVDDIGESLGELDISKFKIRKELH
jgi:hypothetical protein